MGISLNIAGFLHSARFVEELPLEASEGVGVEHDLLALLQHLPLVLAAGAAAHLTAC